MLNALFISPTVNFYCLDGFFVSNKDNINIVYMTSSYFIKYFLSRNMRGLSTTTSDIDEFLNEFIKPVFNNNFYKSHAPISSAEFISALIEYAVNLKNYDCPTIFHWAYYYSIPIILTDPDRLNSVLRTVIQSNVSLLSFDRDIASISNIIKDDNIFYYHLDNDEHDIDRSLMCLSRQLYIPQHAEVVKLSHSDIMPACELGYVYDRLF